MLWPTSSHVGTRHAPLALLAIVLIHLGTIGVRVAAQEAAERNVLRIGFVTFSRPPEALAAYLSAVSAMNEDPGYYLGDESFRIESYFITPLIHGDLLGLGAMRAAMLLGGHYDPFNETVGLTRVAALPDGAPDPDVDVIIIGGPSVAAIAMAPIAELLSKPSIGVLASGDDMSDKV